MTTTPESSEKSEEERRKVEEGRQKGGSLTSPVSVLYSNHPGGSPLIFFFVSICVCGDTQQRSYLKETKIFSLEFEKIGFICREN